jgi:glutamyl-tRNA reductase
MIACKLINNANASLEERENLAKSIFLTPDTPHVLLKTCNRVELYWGEGEISEDIVRHLYRVASGLESALTGERAIQGQLKNAYLEAISKYKLSPQLNRLFQTAMHTGKRARSETGISKGAVSHSQVTVDMLKKENIDLKNKIVSIIGVNKLTEDILKFLTDKQAVNIYLSNRHLEKAEELAKLYKAASMPLREKRKMLAFTDILICATSAPHIMVRREDIPAGKEMLIFDLAFPRDVEPSLGNEVGIRLFDLEDIEQFAKNNLSLRNNEIHEVEQIIEEEIDKFRAWYKHTQKNNYLCGLKT